jgi:hypothetical protein
VSTHTVGNKTVHMFCCFEKTHSYRLRKNSEIPEKFIEDALTLQNVAYISTRAYTHLWQCNCKMKSAIACEQFCCLGFLDAEAGLYLTLVT